MIGAIVMMTTTMMILMIILISNNVIFYGIKPAHELLSVHLALMVLERTASLFIIARNIFVYARMVETFDVSNSNLLPLHFIDSGG